jgi:hypothetical protein
MKLLALVLRPATTADSCLFFGKHNQLHQLSIRPFLLF